MGQDNALAESFFASLKERADRHPALAHQDRGPPRDHGIHRLAQRHPAAQHPGLPQLRRIRNDHYETISKVA
jgi:hypothetical protein